MVREILLGVKKEGGGRGGGGGWEGGGGCPFKVEAGAALLLDFGFVRFTIWGIFGCV
jgi:hypothetical protein